MKTHSHTSDPLGPFIHLDADAIASGAHEENEITPLGSFQWTCRAEAQRITLFRHRPRHAPPLQLRLENVVFRETDGPFDLRCSAYSVAHIGGTTYLPVEALLLALYERGLVCRPVLPLLREFAQGLRFHSRVRCPILARGMLTAAAEREGFRLMSVTHFADLKKVFVTVGWLPHPGADALHACTMTFRKSSGLPLDEGIWTEPRSIGLAQLLGRELRRLSPGKPLEMFTHAGRQRISPSWEARTLQNKNLDEESRSGKSRGRPPRMRAPII